MAMTKKPFGTMAGQAVEAYTLIGADGLEVCVLTYGGTIQALRWQGKDVVLGYDCVEDYGDSKGSYQGAIIGRYANRIAEGRFCLNGTTYDVGCNEAGRGHLHGGRVGFDKRIWKATVLDEGEEPSLRLSLTAADGEEGYPGRVEVTVTFTVTKDHTLHLAYTAQSDKDTVLSLTNHSYFNLNGWDGGDVLDTELTVFAEAITPVDERLIPTGEYRPVAGTPLDFRTPKAIAAGLDEQDEQVRIGGGVDHNFVLGADRAMRHAVHARSPRSGLTVDCYTDLPGVQIYTANFLAEDAGKGGVKLYRHQGFCMETQFFPDSPNQPQFPSTTLRAGETFRSETMYRFG